MMPFDDVKDGLDWIDAHAEGPCEVKVVCTVVAIPRGTITPLMTDMLDMDLGPDGLPWATTTEMGGTIQ
jgi:hypothetical protein